MGLPILFSATIGADPAGQRPSAPTIYALNSAIRAMRPAVLSHPLNTHVSNAPLPILRGRTTTEQNAVSTAMQNLEDIAVRTCGDTLRELGVRTSITINDSILFERQTDPHFWDSCPPEVTAAGATVTLIRSM